jgi:hypothetical protein
MARSAPTPIPSNRGDGRWGKAALSGPIRAHSAVRVSLCPVPMRREAEGHAETALLRLVEALVQRLLGVGQAPQRRRSVGQRIRAIAQALGRIGTLPGSASRLALRDPLLADVTERLLDSGPALRFLAIHLQPGVDQRHVRVNDRWLMPFCLAMSCTSLSARSMLGAPFWSARG